MIEYILNKKTISIEEFNNIEVFGITALENSKTILNIYDISSNKDFVEKIITKLKKYDVSFYHIIDIIEDEIFSYIG